MKLTPPSSPHVGSGHNVFSTDGSLPQSGAKERYTTYKFVQNCFLNFEDNIKNLVNVLTDVL